MIRGEEYEVIERHLRDISHDLADAVSALEGAGVELEAIVNLQCALATRQLGVDVLANTAYGEDVPPPNTSPDLTLPPGGNGEDGEEEEVLHPMLCRRCSSSR
jgi:hypothetical protein